MENIPDSLLNLIRERFENTKEVKMLRIKQASMQKQMRFAEAVHTAQLIDELYEKAVYNYIEMSRDEVAKIDPDALNMSREDDERFLSLLVVIFMSCDIIETASMDINSILKKYDRDLSINMFNEMRENYRMAREKIKYLTQNSNLRKDSVWGYRCDEMLQMMYNKAKKLLNMKQKC